MPLGRAVKGSPELVLGVLLVLALVVLVARHVRALVSVMTSLTAERVTLVVGSVHGIFEDLNAWVCVYCEPCSSGD